MRCSALIERQLLAADSPGVNFSTAMGRCHDINVVTLNIYLAGGEDEKGRNEDRFANVHGITFNTNGDGYI